MKIPITFLGALLCTQFSTSVWAQAPVNNPITEFYGAESSLLWTDEIAWDRVFVVTDYPGTTDMERYVAARDAAWEAGGGIVYFPAGVYTFDDHLYLRDHVILRGADPVDQTVAKEPDYAPPTKFEFPRYVPSFDGNGTPNDTAFKFIYTLNGANDSNIGIVNIDINRAGISFSAGGTPARNRLVFGVRNNNVASPQANIPRDYQHGWQRHAWRFTNNINVYAFENVLIANNRVNDKHYTVDLQLPGWESVETDDYQQPGYIVDNQSGGGVYTALQGHQAVFKYTNHYGIRARGSSGLWGAQPQQQPNLFRDNVQILDNWLYSTMRVGYMLSGDNLVVRGNVRRDMPNKAWWMHPDGHRLVQNAATLENRGIDFAGGSMLIEDNIIEVERHWLRQGAYYSVDGEGIMIQEIHGSIVDDVIIRNNTTNAYIGIYKMPYVRNLEITGNTLTRRSGLTSDSAYIMVESDTNNSPFPMFNVLVEDNTLVYSGGINVKGRSGGSNVIVRNNTGNGGTLRFGDYIQHSGNTGFNPTIQTYVTTGTITTYPEIELSVITPQVLLQGETATFEVAALNAVPIQQVELYANSTLIATLTEAPYTFNWSPGLGRYQFVAIARPVDTATAWFTISRIERIEVINHYTQWLRNNVAVDSRLSHVELFGEGISNLQRFGFDLPAAPGQDTSTLPSMSVVEIEGENHLAYRYSPRSDAASVGVNVTTQWSNNFSDWNLLDPLSLPSGFTYNIMGDEVQITVDPEGTVFLRTQISIVP